MTHRKIDDDTAVLNGSGTGPYPQLAPEALEAAAEAEGLPPLPSPGAAVAVLESKEYDLHAIRTLATISAMVMRARDDEEIQARAYTLLTADKAADGTPVRCTACGAVYHVGEGLPNLAIAGSAAGLCFPCATGAQPGDIAAGRVEWPKAIDPPAEPGEIVVTAEQVRASRRTRRGR